MSDQIRMDGYEGLPHGAERPAGAQRCERCGVPGKSHADIVECADAQIAYYAAETGRCSCGAPEPCVAPRFGGRHVPAEVWLRDEIG